MEIDFSGRGLFVFSDPGGAKPTLALVESLKNKLSSYKIISDREYSFYDNFSVSVNLSTLSAITEIEEFSPSFVFLGTSYTSALELSYIKAAKTAGIYSFSFVDHWTSIKERFNDQGTFVFPDKILVLDDRAKLIALEEGIDINLLGVFANPYHLFLANWKPKVNKKNFMASLGLENHSKNIALYAPDPLSNIQGSSKYGFDEISATKKLNVAIDELSNDFTFVLNPHPNQDMTLLTPVLDSRIIVISKGTDVNTLIYYSDVVIGFFSNFLIEASIMGKLVLRFFITESIKDPLESLEVGEIVTPKNIIPALKSIK